MFGKDKSPKAGGSLPSVKVSKLGPAEVSTSDRRLEEQALNGLWREMSHRRLLTVDGADEDIQAMRVSAESLLVSHVGPARDALPHDSHIDQMLEEIGDALNAFRTTMERDDFRAYRPALRDLREDVQALVGRINKLVPTSRGQRLFTKIDPGSAEFGPITLASENHGEHLLRLDQDPPARGDEIW